MSALSKLSGASVCKNPLKIILALFDQYQEVMDHLLKTSGDVRLNREAAAKGEVGSATWGPFR